MAHVSWLGIGRGGGLPTILGNPHAPDRPNRRVTYPPLRAAKSWRGRNESLFSGITFWCWRRARNLIDAD
eukprot:5100073-Lingulodinium_polyedra.AAC.1